MNLGQFVAGQEEIARERRPQRLVGRTHNERMSWASRKIAEYKSKSQLFKAGRKQAIWLASNGDATKIARLRKPAKPMQRMGGERVYNRDSDGKFA